MGDQVGLGGGSGIVYVIFDAEVVSDVEFLVGDHLKDLARGRGEIGIGAGEYEAGVLATGKFEIFKTRGEIIGLGGEGNAGAIDLRFHLVKTGVAGDLVVLGDGGDELVKVLPGLGGSVLERTGFFDEDEMGCGPGDGFGAGSEIERWFWCRHEISPWVGGLGKVCSGDGMNASVKARGSKMYKVKR